MSAALPVWSLLLQAIASGRAATLLYVVESRGSSPGRAGFCMALADDGRMEGSIGGGMMEHKLVELARARMKECAVAEIRKQVHSKQAPRDQSGMICSGEQTVLLYPVSKKDEAAIRAIVSSLSAQEPGRLLLTPEGIGFSTGRSVTEFRKDEKDWRFQTTIGEAPVIHIVGGGHCSLALSQLMRQLGFVVQVYEDRPGLHTLEQNTHAHHRHIVEEYPAIGNLITNEADYVVLMSFGYRTDGLALRALRERRFRYLGVLGSKKKIEQLWAELRTEGCSENWLSSIHAPVGLDIKSETPMEIAVSIAAQIVQVKNRG